MATTPRASRCELADILPLRQEFLAEAAVQVRFNACHERGWTDSYLLSMDGQAVGYGSVRGQEIADRDTVFEFYVTPAHRSSAAGLFETLLAAARPRWIEWQTNLPLGPGLLYEYAQDIYAEAILFADGPQAGPRLRDGAVFRSLRPGEGVFEHQSEPPGTHVLQAAGEVVATGGFLLHYNPPFADLYMEVRPDYRRRGYGAALVAQLREACRLAGRAPAARCNVENRASRATLLKAGMTLCGYILRGEVPAAMTKF